MEGVESIKFLIDTIELLVSRAKEKIGSGRTKIQVIKDVLVSIGDVSRLNLGQINRECRDLSASETIELVLYIKAKGFTEKVAERAIEKIKSKDRATVLNLLKIFIAK